MAGRKPSGEGSLYRRGDGRWAGAASVDTVSGRRKRIHVYAATRQEVHDQLADKLIAARKGIRTPDKEWTVGAYLDYWLGTVVTVKNRPRTAELYASTVRLHLAPTLGTIRLTKLTVQDVQTLLNRHLAQGRSLRSVHQVRSVLRAALSRAQREEFVVRNVAKLVDLRAWKRKSIQPWTAEEAARFLAAATSHRLYPAYAMLLVYGMRRGEVLGLRWCDVDFTHDQLHIHQQLQRIGKTLDQGPVKTDAGRRDLPLIPVIRKALTDQYVKRHGDQLDVAVIAQQAASDQELVFLSTAGTPIDPKNFVRAFQQIREKAGLPRITVHHTRHTAATMLKNLGVPARDAQLILGHAHVTTTQQLYQHGDLSGQTQALVQVEAQLFGRRRQQPLLSTTAVKSSYPQVKARTFMRLTSGEAAETRTQDTLLKSLMLSADNTAATPVIQHLRTRAYALILGHVAVKYCCQTTPNRLDADTNLADWIAILHALGRVEIDIMRERSFPLSLLPVIRPHDTQRSDMTQEGAAA